MPSKPDLRELARRDPRAAERALASALKGAMVPHPAQAEVLADTHRFQILTAGRRFGKTKLAARRIVREALAGEDRLCWWVANYYKNTRRGYQEVVRQIPRELFARPAPASSANELRLQLVNGTVIEFYSGQSPDALVGAGVDFLVMDEAALIGEDVWFQHLRPTLMDTGGATMMISTPRGRNWFWRMWNLGQRGTSDYRSWRFTSYDNPYVPDSELDESKEVLPDLVFRQEVMAEFVESAASIFDLSRVAVIEDVLRPTGQHAFLGIDLAKQRDFTVLTGDRADGMPCYYDRFNQIDWGSQRRRIADAVTELHNQGATGVTLVVDSTGIGDVIYDDLLDAGYDVIGVNFSSGPGGRMKERMVRRLAADMERNEAALLAETVDEFEVYEYEITPNGRWTFEAAVGHDDKVSSKLLAHWGRVVEGVPTVRLGNVRDAVVGETEGSDEIAAPLVPDTARDIAARPEAWSSFDG